MDRANPNPTRSKATAQIIRPTRDAISGLASTVWFSWRWYAVAAVAGGIAWWRSGDRPALLITLAILGVTFLSALVQAKGFGYHFGGFLPVLGLLAAAALARLGAAALNLR